MSLVPRYLHEVLIDVVEGNNKREDKCEENFITPDAGWISKFIISPCKNGPRGNTIERQGVIAGPFPLDNLFIRS